MSYILEALRRAEAEREREAGTVPTLNAQVRPLPPPDDDTAAGRHAPGWLWPAVGLVLAGATAAVWWAQHDNAPPPSAIARAPAPVPTALPVPVPAPVVASAPAAVATPSPPPAAVPATPPAPDAMPANAPPRPVAPPRPALRSPATAERPAAASTSATRILRLAELSEAQRRALPPLSIGGSIYSPDRDARMVIVNGQVRREGEAVAPGLVLEQIGTRSAILGFKGIRIEMPL